MHTRAAILTSQPGTWEVVDAELDAPGDDEVLVRVVASGLCHSDDHVAKGDGRVAHLPYCGGHEVAGTVEAVGARVTTVRRGDHVVSSFIPACGRCRPCASGRQNLCDNGALLQRGAQADGRFRLHVDGQDVARSSLIGGFAEWSVMPEWSCIKIPPDVPMPAAALLGCGVPTGWGSAVHAAAVRPGDVVVVMGVGGVGINAVQGAAHAGAAQIIAVDPVAAKRDWACRLGATDAVADMALATALVQSATNGQGADAVIITVGVLQGEHVAEAFDAVRKGGTVVVTAVAPMALDTIPISPFVLAMYEKRIQGCLYGSMAPNEAVPRLLDLYRRGRLELDALVSRTYRLEEIELGYQDMHAGRNLRGMLRFD